MLDDQPLLSLLQQYQEALPCWETSTQITRSHCTRPIRTEEVKTIYRSRARLNMMNNGPLQGYDKLLSELDVYSEDKIVICTLNNEMQSCIVFVNPSMTNLVGVLRMSLAQVIQPNTKDADP